MQRALSRQRYFARRVRAYCRGTHRGRPLPRPAALSGSICSSPKFFKYQANVLIWREAKRFVRIQEGGSHFISRSSSVTYKPTQKLHYVRQLKSLGFLVLIPFVVGRFAVTARQ